ncbi:hypothetical protein BKN14_04575 [Candidatus Gracilibacteria bacterium HOT-871]|nr:hypothetical protein BKN14_04575 [Candidatus Gracilibacteria bacterium HOT-871]RKW21582.1 MAG: NUDIX hydrolase [Candidatus Gracilibacteria bacterium]
MKIPEKIFEKIIVSNPYLKVSQKDYIDEKGNKSSFLITGHNKKESIGTMILPITSDGQILYLKEYRYGPEKFVINFPVGMLDDGISEIENCKKELLEETGYISDEIELLTESIIENYFEGTLRYFVAKNCKKLKSQELEAGENIEIFSSSLEDFQKLILDGKVLSSKTAFCFFLAKAKGYF